MSGFEGFENTVIERGRGKKKSRAILIDEDDAAVALGWSNRAGLRVVTGKEKNLIDRLKLIARRVA
jgi:hypothetical protein